MRVKIGRGGALVMTMTACAIVLAACAVPETGVVDDPSEAPTAEPTAAPTAAADLAPYLTIAGIDEDGAHVSASGGVRGVVESDGACAFVFTSESGSTVELDSTGVSDATGTSCGFVQAEIDRFTSGTWTLVLDYSSPTGSASSAPQEVEIP